MLFSSVTHVGRRLVPAERVSCDSHADCLHFSESEALQIKAPLPGSNAARHVEHTHVCACACTHHTQAHTPRTNTHTHTVLSLRSSEGGKCPRRRWPRNARILHEPCPFTSSTRPTAGVSPGAVTLIGASLRAAVRVHTGFHSVTPTGSPSSLGHLPGPEGQQAVASP